MQGKLELGGSMAPEMEVSSTVVSGNSNNSSDSDHSNEMQSIATVSGINLNSSGVNTNTVPPTTLVCVQTIPAIVSVPNSLSHQTQNKSSDSVFQLAFTTAGSNNSLTAQGNRIKTTIAKQPTIQQQQLQQIGKMQGIVYANPSINTIQLQQSQLQAKILRQSTQPSTSNAHPLLNRAIQRAQKIQLAQLPSPVVTQPTEKCVNITVCFIQFLANFIKNHFYFFFVFLV